MNMPFKERRRLSQSGLLDSAIRLLAVLASSGSSMDRSRANQALMYLQQLRRELPTRRQSDLR
jgi:hypothetical protein